MTASTAVAQLRLAWSPEQVGIGRLGARGRDEYWTRECDLAPARAVLGEFELDTASCALANERVRARRIYTIEDDALRLQWKAATAWFNPPYSRCREFVTKLVWHYDSGDIGAAIAFISLPSIGDQWFHDIGGWRFPLCVRYGRARFDGPDGNGKSGRAGHAWLYLGPESSRFAEAFAPFGAVVIARVGTTHTAVKDRCDIEEATSDFFATYVADTLRLRTTVPIARMSEPEADVIGEATGSTHAERIQ